MGCSPPKAGNTVSAPSASYRFEEPCASIDFARSFFENHLLDVKLGQGCFSQVRRLVRLPTASHAGGGSTFAQEKCAKIYDLRDSRQPGKAGLALQDLAAMEAHILKNVGHHPNVVEFHGAYMCEGICFLAMEKCVCSLYQYMKNMPMLNEKSMGKLVFQMLSALHHLHSARVVHRDVRPDNFLIGGVFGNKVKLCDFGLAAMLPDQGMLCTPVDMTPFTCPEMLVGECYDTRADVWSLAVTVYVFNFGTFPYESNDGTTKRLVQAIMKGTPPKLDSAEGNSACGNFVRALLRRNYENRPSAEEALNLPFIVAVLSCTRKSSTLPSLHPMLKSALKAGAVLRRDHQLRSNDLDEVLRTLQLEKNGVRMPDESTLQQLPNEDSFQTLSGVPSSIVDSESTSCGSGSTRNSLITL